MSRRGILVTGAPTLDDLGDPGWRPGPLQWLAVGPPEPSDDVMDEDEPSSLQILAPHSQLVASRPAHAESQQASLLGSYGGGSGSWAGDSFANSYMPARHGAGPPASAPVTFQFQDGRITELSDLEAAWAGAHGEAPLVELVGYIVELTPAVMRHTRGRDTWVCNFVLGAAGSGSLSMAVWGDAAKEFSDTLLKYDVVWLRCALASCVRL